MQIPPPETIRTTSLRVACDGSGAVPAALGHPRVYLHIEDHLGFVECGYCDRRFVLEGGPADLDNRKTGGPADLDNRETGGPVDLDNRKTGGPVDAPDMGQGADTADKRAGYPDGDRGLGGPQDSVNPK